VSWCLYKTWAGGVTGRRVWVPPTLRNGVTFFGQGESIDPSQQCGRLTAGHPAGT